MAYKAGYEHLNFYCKLLKNFKGVENLVWEVTVLPLFIGCYLKDYWNTNPIGFWSYWIVLYFWTTF